MTIVQKPSPINLSGNLPSFIMFSDDPFNFVIKKGNISLLSGSYTPGGDRKVTIDVKDVIEFSLSFQFRDILETYTQDTLIDTFYAYINDELICNFEVIKGGISNFGMTPQTFLQQHFLTWQPREKRVSYSSPEYLTYYAVTDCRIKLKAYMSTVDAIEMVISELQQGKVYTIPVMYAVVAGKLNAYPAYYDIWVESADGSVRYSYIQRFVYEQGKSEQEEYIIFENSLGGVDCFRAYGNTVFNADNTHNIAIIDDQLNEYRIDTEYKYTKNTGYLTKYEAEWLKDFFPSTGKYIFRNNILRKIVLTEDNVSSSEQESVNSYEFTYRYADDNIYLNLPVYQNSKKLISPMSLNVDNVEKSLGLEPRLAEFPMQKLSEGSLIPVQEPFSERWNATNAGAIANYIIEKINSLTDGRLLDNRFKGYYLTETSLKESYPNPLKGDSAWVGEPFPGVVYTVENGKWKTSGKAPDFGDINLEDYATKEDLAAQDSKLTELSSSIVDISNQNLHGYYGSSGKFTENENYRCVLVKVENKTIFFYNEPTESYFGTRLFTGSEDSLVPYSDDLNLVPTDGTGYSVPNEVTFACFIWNYNNDNTYFKSLIITNDALSLIKGLIVKGNSIELSIYKEYTYNGFYGTNGKFTEDENYRCILLPVHNSTISFYNSSNLFGVRLFKGVSEDSLVPYSDDLNLVPTDGTGYSVPNEVTFACFIWANNNDNAFGIIKLKNVDNVLYLFDYLYKCYSINIENIFRLKSNIKDLGFVDLSKNLHGYYGSNGKFIEDESHRCILVKLLGGIKFKNASNTSYFGTRLFTGSEDNLVQYSSDLNLVPTDGKIYKVPSEVTFACFIWNKNEDEHWYKDIELISGYLADIYNELSMIKGNTISNISSYIENGYYGSSGKFTENENYRCVLLSINERLSFNCGNTSYFGTRLFTGGKDSLVQYSDDLNLVPTDGKIYKVPSEVTFACFIWNGNIIDTNGVIIASGYNAAIENNINNINNYYIIEVDCDGDSLTQGVGGISWVEQIQGMINNVKFVNYGQGGDLCQDILARTGAINLTFEEDVVMPSEGSCSVKLRANDVLYTSNKTNLGINPCTVNGIECTLTTDYDNVEQGIYTLTRNSSGEEMKIVKGDILFPYQSKLRQNIHIFYMGQNNADVNTPENLQIVLDNFEQASKYCEKYIFVTTAINTNDELEEKMGKLYGNRYINLRHYCLYHALDELGITPTSEDNEAISNKKCPPSLLSDTIHFNATGYKGVALEIKRRLYQLGYILPPSSVTTIKYGK